MALCYPLDVIRQKQQVTTKGSRQLGFMDVVTEELEASSSGWRVFYQGLGPTLTAIGSSSLLYFYMYNLLKRVVERRGRALSVTANLVVAYIAGLFNAVLTSPLWVVSHRTKTGGSKGQGMLTLILRMMHEEGPSVMFAGLTPSIILCSNPAIQFTVYERMRLQILSDSGSAILTPAVGFGLGLFAKAVATVFTYPTQVLQSVTREAHSEGIWKETIKIWERQGVGGFFQGICAKLIQTGSNAALMFMCYEQLLIVASWLLVTLQKRLTATARASVAAGLTAILLLNSWREYKESKKLYSPTKSGYRFAPSTWAGSVHN